MNQWLDWSALGFLALVTLLDGLRRVPAGAFVLRRTIGGKWAVVPLGEGYALVSWWPPISTTLVLAGGAGDGGARPVTDDEPQWATVRRNAFLLMVPGGLCLLALLVGIPVSMRWFGGWGFLLSLLIVLLLSWLLTALTYFFSRSLGLSTRQRVLFALPRLNPFAAPASGEAFLERAVAGANPFAVARRLMTEEDFLAWIRPTAYDVTHGEGSSDAALTLVIPREDLRKMVAAPPAGIADLSPWCPRCGAEFGSATTTCPACDIPLKI